MKYAALGFACDWEAEGFICDEESSPATTWAGARYLAKQEGWYLGRTDTAYCPAHR